MSEAWLQNLFYVSDVWQTFCWYWFHQIQTSWNQPKWKYATLLCFYLRVLKLKGILWYIIPQLIIENQAIDKEDGVHFIQGILPWICLSVIFNWLFWHRRHYQSSWICISREGFVTNFGAMVIGGTQFLALTLGIGKTFGFSFIFSVKTLPYMYA